jgi:hypothetical protein
MTDRYFSQPAERKSKDLVCPHCRSRESAEKVQQMFHTQAGLAKLGMSNKDVEGDCPSCRKWFSTADFLSR